MKVTLSLKKIYKLFLILLFVYQFQYCANLNDWLVDFFSKNYEAEARNFTPVFEGRDKDRKKIMINLVKVFKGDPQITSIQFMPGESNIYIATIKSGELYVYDFNSKKKFLVKKFNVLTSSEQGLLGIAFHPEFQKNKLLYLHYSIGKNNKKFGRISEFMLTKVSDSKPYQLKNERVVIEIEQPYANHNGGHLEFGNDGYLYIGLGDGGWRDDPHNNGQNPNTLLGSILRIDVKPSPHLPYSIPSDNPYSQNSGWRKEIFAIGLRNPWKFAPHPTKDFLIVADVGQDQFEEISLVEKGKNYGWRIKEGYQCYLDRNQCIRNDLIDPIYVYDHSEGQSITGGYIYISEKIPELKNKYIFGDFVQGKIWALTIEDKQKIKEEEVYALGKWPILISTFGRTPEGEVLIGDYHSGKIFKFEK